MKQDIPRLEGYLRKLFGAPTLAVRPAAAKGKAEVLLGPRPLGQIVADTEDGETTYHFEMAILEMDLPPATVVPKKS